ncbi:MAG: tyrosine-type recombinase/integrase [Alphaproteobacteria bacterium]
MGNQKIRHLVAKPQKGGHVLWYWQPSAALRRTGLFLTRRLAERTGKLSDAIVEAELLNAEVDAWRAGLVMQPVRPGTIPALVKTYRKDAAYTELAEKTRKEYEASIAIIEKWSASVGHPLVAGIDRAAVRKLSRELAEPKPTKEGGKPGKPRLARARAVVAVLRILLGVAIEEGLITVNPAANLRLAKPKARQVIWSAEQVRTFCAKAVEEKVPSLALAVLLAANIGQRQGDVLRLQWSQFDGASIKVTQNKTDKLVQVPVSAELLEALRTAARTSTAILVAEATGRPYKADHFRHEFTRVRDAAGLAGLWFLDLRRTAVVWLAEAGCNPIEISAITGHDLDTTMAILEVYLPRTLPMARAAIAKLDEHRSRTKLEAGRPKSEV